MKRSPGPDGPAVDRDTGGGPVAHGLADGGGRGVVSGPEIGGHAELSSAATVSRATRGVIERVGGVVDNLAGFMTFAGNHQQIHRFQQGQRSADSLAPVADFDAVGAGGHDLGTDRCRVFAARVVVGDNGDVGGRLGDLAHHRPLAGVAVAATAKHNHQPTIGVRAHGGQDGFERVRGMGIVDEHRCAIGMDGDPLHPARRALKTGAGPPLRRRNRRR